MIPTDFHIVQRGWNYQPVYYDVKTALVFTLKFAEWLIVVNNFGVGIRW